MDLSEETLRNLSDEDFGTRARITSFYLARLRRLQAIARAPLRVLDCGCGNGLSVDLLVEQGFDAWGNDPSRLRRWQWRKRSHSERLSVSDGAALPFPDAFFDAVIGAGVLKHIGVTESVFPRYRVSPRPDRDEARTCFLKELLRVVKPEGRVWLDFPNGLFPIDFWHGTGASGIRLHSLREGFLPSARDVRRLISSLDSSCRVEAVSPAGRLAFRRVKRHWYGRLLWLPVSALFSLMALRPFSWLAAGPLNPYLVLEITRKGRSERVG